MSLSQRGRDLRDAAARERGFLGDLGKLRSRVGRIWRSTSLPVRRGIAFMWAVGLTAGAAGIAGDLTGTWSALPFLTNLATSITAFFVGAPVALLLLQDVARHIARRTEQDVAITLLRQGARSLGADLEAALVHTQVPYNPSGPGLPSQLPETLARAQSLLQSDTSQADVDAAVRRMVDQWSQDPVLRAVTGGVAGTRSTCVRLRDVVRLRFLQFDLPWPLEGVLDELIETCEGLAAYFGTSGTKRSSTPWTGTGTVLRFDGRRQWSVVRYAAETEVEAALRAADLAGDYLRLLQACVDEAAWFLDPYS
ncbi:hypothetical protein [Nonomuraea longicatena]